MSTHTTTPAPQTIELIRRLLEAAHRPEPANDPTICAICGAPLQIVRHGDAYPADGNHRRTYQSLEARGYAEDVGYGRYAITAAGQHALQRDLS